MRREFMVERNGRTFCLYAGLLDMAHDNGLKSIQTDVIQIPNAETNHVAIFRAVVVLEKDGVERTFTAYADAAPNNVAQAMQNCLLRMAETRAKARALRDAVNVGVAAFEELDASGNTGDDTPGDSSQKQKPARRAVAPVAGTGLANVNSSGVQCASCHAPHGSRHSKTCVNAYEAQQQAA